MGRVESRGMATLLLALAFAAGTTVGLGLGPPGCAPLLLALAGALAGVAVLWGRPGRFHAGCGVMALGLCGWVHGGLAERAPGPFPDGEGVVRLVVVGASTPHGGRCEVEVLPVGSEQRWRLWVDPARCPLAEGQEVWALAGDLSSPAGPRRAAVWSPPSPDQRGALVSQRRASQSQPAKRAAWVEAADQMDRPYLRAVVTGAKGTEDPYCEWQRRREISEAGALLVRPDGFVAWRHQAAVRDVAEARRLLEQALDTVLSIKR